MSYPIKSLADDQPSGAVVRLAHFSDIHIAVAGARWRRRDWLSKRLTGWANYRLLGRRHRFEQSDAVPRAFRKELADWKPDRIVFSGDATALGFEEEVERASALLDVAGSFRGAGITVPGNHDYYTPADEASGLFERYFAPWQEGERMEGWTYPFAQRVGPIWLVATNSCTGHRWPSDASGWVDPAELRRLAELLKRLSPGPRILVTHYPVCLANGEPEAEHHGLRNLAELVQVAADGGVCLWLHGHRHHFYWLDKPKQAPFPVICAGSLTDRVCWSYGAYTIRGRHLQARQRVFWPESGLFKDAGSFELALGCAPSEPAKGAR